MLNEIEFEDIYAFHPSSYLEDYLEGEKITKKTFATKNNISINKLEAFINGEIDVNEKIAEKLYKATDISEGTWLRMQSRFDNKLKEIIKRRTKKLDSFSSADIIDVASYIANEYKEITKDNSSSDDTSIIIDKLKLQKLLYFTQRESIAINGKPAFKEDLEGWKHGPVSPLVYKSYSNGKFDIQTKDISEGLKYIIDNVIEGYGALDSWKLRNLSHKEISWINSRENLDPNEEGHNPLKLDDIKIDAEKIRPFDYKLGVYYDDEHFFEKYK